MAASTGTRAGHVVPLHYGSAAGELALCMRSVGLVNREDLAVLAVEGDPFELDRLTAQRFVDGLRPGAAASTDGVHWGRTGPTQIFVAGSPETLLLDGPAAAETDELSVTAVELVSIAVVGPGTRGLLLDLGLYGSLGAGEGGRAASIAGAAWLLLDDAFALALVEPSRALAIWEVLTSAGRRFGLGYVGAEAAERFELTRCAAARPRRALF